MGQHKIHVMRQVYHPRQFSVCSQSRNGACESFQLCRRDSKFELIYKQTQAANFSNEQRSLSVAKQISNELKTNRPDDDQEPVICQGQTLFLFLVATTRVLQEQT